jgi:hypothetical protein
MWWGLGQEEEKVLVVGGVVVVVVAVVVLAAAVQQGQERGGYNRATAQPSPVSSPDLVRPLLRRRVFSKPSLRARRGSRS